MTTLVDLKERFCQLLTPPLPNDWEVEENLEQLRGLPTQRQEVVLRQVPAIWPVSNSLCYSYLASVGPALSCLADQQIPGWVNAILAIYEREGLREAQQFMADAEGNYLCQLRGESGVELAALPHLVAYLQGVAGQPLRLAPGPELGTDGETIWLPAKVALFAGPKENFLYYKLLLTLQAGLLQIGTYRLPPGGLDFPPPVLRAPALASGTAASPNHLGDFFRLFAQPRLAEEIFTLVEARRLLHWLAATFPGLWRDCRPLLQQIAEAEGAQPLASAEAIGQLRRLVLAESAGLAETPATAPWFSQIREAVNQVEDSARLTVAIYGQLGQGPQPGAAMPPLPWLGRLQPEAFWQCRLRQRQQTKDTFIKGLALVLAEAREAPESDPEAPGHQQKPASSEQSATAALLLASGQSDAEEQEQHDSSAGQTLVTLETLVAELPESLREVASAIVHDLGAMPPEYVSAAQGLAGHGPPARAASESGAGEALTQPLIYDEWDFRRQGYRKDWCAVHEKILPPVKSSLIETTLAKYRGQVRQLRKQFELLRAGERFLRRQRDGADLDLDAVIESLSDQRAGRAASDQLFVRLRRDQRDIAVYFLVDMSSSTEGWVNLALKEALILTGEALQTIGDRFAIAGFSGMRRSRSDFYLVKDFAEPYNAEVKGRICAIAPREYTRMGPALRHASQLLRRVEAKVRLLFVLSDGKPEDYDDYKGKYAIEDTRHALIEAKAAGIHPFCLTIDRQAHDYMAHLFGEVNYIFLDEVGKLPLRMPAIYRGLTG